MIPWQIEVLFIIALAFATPFLIFWYSSLAENFDTMLESFFWFGVFWAGLYFLAKWWFVWR